MSRTIAENIAQSISDFDSIKGAMEQRGVAVPNGTPTRNYANLLAGVDGTSPVISVEYGQNQRSYLLTKGATRMSTIRWCDAADNDRQRRLEFGAAVHCKREDSYYSWRIQVRTESGGDAGLLFLGSYDGNKVAVYNPMGTFLTLVSAGYHEYAVSWNMDSGDYTIYVDGVPFEGNSSSLVMARAHGLQINGDWPEVYGDTIQLYSFRLYGDGKVRIDDDFSEEEEGTICPTGWYANDSSAENQRSVVVTLNSDVYLRITDAEGTKRTGNLKGADAVIADGSVGMEHLSGELKELLEQLSTLLPPNGGGTS